MKKIAFILLIVIIFGALKTTSVQAQNNFTGEIQNLFSQGEITSTFKGFFSHSYNNELGMFAFTFINKYWAETYVGPTWKPNEFIMFGAGAGIEQIEGFWRVGGFIGAGYKNCHVLILLEDGASGFWYQAVADVKLHELLKIGIMAESKLDVGPTVEIGLPGQPVKLWGTIFKDSQYAGIKFNF